MTADQAIEILDSAGEGCTEEDWNTALNMGIAALEDGLRYEKMLLLAMGTITDCDSCPIKSCDGIVDNCDERIIAYFKRQAGIKES